MSSNYAGEASNITFASTVSIASSTDANPIVITTATAHGLVTGETVHIDGHQTNTAANGVWEDVQVLLPTTFSIAATGNGVGGATGTVQNLSLGTCQLPSDGDNEDAVSVNVGLEFLSDAAAFQAQTTGAYKIVAEGTIPSATGTASSITTAGSGTWATTAIETTGPATFVLTGLCPGDIVETDCVWPVNISASSGAVKIGIIVGFFTYGGSATFTSPSSSTPLTTGSQTSTSGVYTPVTLVSSDTVPSSCNCASFALAAQTLASTEATLATPAVTVRYRVLRPTAVPQ